jgi:citrate synthase
MRHRQDGFGKFRRKHGRRSNAEALDGGRVQARGDPRAIAAIGLLPADRTLSRILAIATPWKGQAPSIDFALVASRRCQDLPRGTAFGLFVPARTMAWIAHIMEQRRTAAWIRPRAS